MRTTPGDTAEDNAYVLKLNATAAPCVWLNTDLTLRFEIAELFSTKKKKTAKEEKHSQHIETMVFSAFVRTRLVAED